MMMITLMRRLKPSSRWVFNRLKEPSIRSAGKKERRVVSLVSNKDAIWRIQQATRTTSYRTTG